MSACAYCGKRRAVHTDHLITQNQARRKLEAARFREHPQFKVRSCSECNWAKGNRLRVPRSHEALIPQLEELTGSVYAVWDGELETLREVVK